MGNKRKNENNTGADKKKAKRNTGAARKDPNDAPADSSAPPSKPDAQSSRPRIRKLAPQRPFPTVSAASSATGPRSAHHEGKNNICITRKTKLAAYLRRCKALLVDDDFKEIRLSAMGAAIPHLALLAVSLPPILPWAEDEVHVDVFTGSLEVHDEVLSESGSEAEDGPQEDFRTRIKSTMNVIIRVGKDGESPLVDSSTRDPTPRTTKKGHKRVEGKGGGPEQIVLQEPEQDGMETS